MRKRTYLKKGRWHVDRRQRGGFFPIAAPILASVAGSVAQPILGKLVKKILGGRRKRRRRRRHKIAC